MTQGDGETDRDLENEDEETGLIARLQYLL